MKAGPFAIEEKFQITGRGVVVVVAVVTELPVGRELQATLSLPDGTRLEGPAWKESLLRLGPMPHEKEAYLLVGRTKAEISEGTVIELTAI